MFEAFLILAASAAGQTADPLAPARKGMVQCVRPNETAKKCMGISTYKIAADGSFQTSTELMFAPTPLITITVVSAGVVKDGMLCGPVRKSDFAAAKVQMDGKPANEAMASALRAQVLGSVEAMDGKMSCGVEAADGSVKVTLDGVAHPELNQRVKWVKPSDGYTIGQ